jgi:FlaG/FlaF family flagellin (archaellin)
MKTKKMDLIPMVILTVIVVVLCGLFIAWLTGTFKDKKVDMDSGTEKIDSAIGAMADFDLLVYDGDVIRGKSLTKLISEFKAKDVQVSICVHTLDGEITYYNYAYTGANLGDKVNDNKIPPTDKASDGYITPSGSFLGEVIKNTNGEIVCLRFTQQK